MANVIIQYQFIIMVIIISKVGIKYFNERVNESDYLW